MKTKEDSDGLGRRLCRIPSDAKNAPCAKTPCYQQHCERSNVYINLISPGNVTRDYPKMLFDTISRYRYESKYHYRTWKVIKILKNLPIQGPVALWLHTTTMMHLCHTFYFIWRFCVSYMEIMLQFNSRGQCFHLEDASGLKLCSLSVHLLNVFYLYII